MQSSFLIDRPGIQLKKLRLFKTLLLPLPAASPELNPVEQLWQQLRDSELGNRSYEDYEGIIQSGYEAWNNYVNIPQAIQKLCSRHWAKTNN